MIYDNLKVAPANIPNGGTRQSVQVTAAGVAVRKQVASATTGLYRVDKLPPGVYRLKFSAPDAYAWSIENVLVCAKSDTVRDTSSPRMHARVMDAMMRALPGLPGELTVHVTTPAGRPVTGATLTVTRLDDRASAAATTGEDGSHVFAHLGAGDYSLNISGPGLEARTFPKVSVAASRRQVMTEQVCVQPP